jgi:hypothetical protein
MFISKAEKNAILDAIATLNLKVSALRGEVFDLKLAAGMTKPVKPVKAEPRKKVGWTDETRKKQGERMKQYWADRKPKETAQ